MASMYFIAIVLPAEVNKLVLSYKNMMQEKYGCMVGLKSPAHITLIPPFWMSEDLEENLINDINLVSREMEPIDLCTNNFSAFRPRTIFIATEKNNRLDEIKRKLDDHFSHKTEYGLSIDTRPFHPHITIATRDLHKKAFYEAWDFFEGKTFRESCLIKGISVLRHNKKNWDVIFTSQFKEV
jgi:2'-5' RNA ligase